MKRNGVMEVHIILIIPMYNVASFSYNAWNFMNIVPFECRIMRGKSSPWGQKSWLPSIDRWECFGKIDDGKIHSHNCVMQMSTLFNTGKEKKKRNKKFKIPITFQIKQNNTYLHNCWKWLHSLFFEG